MMTPSKNTSFALLAICGLVIAACAASEMLREEVADRLAAPAWMIKRPVQAGPFILTARERMHSKGAPATLYIEGSGEEDQRGSN